jgi:hypothetical protein
MICRLIRVAGFFAFVAAVYAAPEMLIESLDGPVTPGEIAAFKTYMQAQPLPTDNEHNAMVYGSAGAAVEALGTVYEVTKDRAVLDRMLEFTDAMLAGRNDPKSGRVLWTGERELAWPNKRPDDASAKYSGTENGDVIGHIAYAAELILRDAALAEGKVGSGDPHHWGERYGQRARAYVRELDRSIDTFVVKWLVDPKTLHYRWPESELYGTLGAREDKSRGKGIPWNQQMMLNNGFQRLAACHALLKDDPARTAHYDAIVQASCDWFLSQVKRYSVDGVECYKWSYATDDGPLKYIEDTGHAGYDILVARVLASGRYRIPAEAMQPFANTLRHVIARGPAQFAQRVDGSGPVRAEIGSTWLFLAEFDPAVFPLVATAGLAHAKTKPDMAARILWWKQRRAAMASAVPAGNR